MDEENLKSFEAGPFLYTPEAIADIISPIIKDKIVCDVGCRAGIFMKHLSKYAKEVIGIEQEVNAVMKGRERGYNIIHGKVGVDNIPDADIYYVWVNPPNLVLVIEALPNKPIIIGNYHKYPKIQKYLKEKEAITLYIPSFGFIKNECGQLNTFGISFLWPK